MSGRYRSHGVFVRVSSKRWRALRMRVMAAIAAASSEVLVRLRERGGPERVELLLARRAERGTAGIMLERLLEVCCTS